MRLFKRTIVDVLDEHGVEDYPQFYRDLLRRIDDGRHTTAVAQPLEEERFALSQEQVGLYCEQLRAFKAQDLDPNRISNYNTAFGASHRLKPTKLIVDNSWGCTFGIVSR